MASFMAHCLQNAGCLHERGAACEAFRRRARFGACIRTVPLSPTTVLQHNGTPLEEVTHPHGMHSNAIVFLAHFKHLPTPFLPFGRIAVTKAARSGVVRRKGVARVWAPGTDRRTAERETDGEEGLGGSDICDYTTTTTSRNTSPPTP